MKITNDQASGAVHHSMIEETEPASTAYGSRWYSRGPAKKRRDVDPLAGPGRRGRAAT